MSRSALTNYFRLLVFLFFLSSWLLVCGMISTWTFVLKSACCFQRVVCAWEAILVSLDHSLLFTSRLTVFVSSCCLSADVSLIPLTITGKVVFSLTFGDVFSLVAVLNRTNRVKKVCCAQSWCVVQKGNILYCVHVCSFLSCVAYGRYYFSRLAWLKQWSGPRQACCFVSGPFSVHSMVGARCLLLSPVLLSRCY